MKKEEPIKIDLLKEELTAGRRTHWIKRVSEYQVEIDENKKKIVDSVVGGGLFSLAATYGFIAGKAIASGGSSEGAAIIYFIAGMQVLFATKYGKDAYFEIKQQMVLKENRELIKETLKIDQDLKAKKKLKVK